MNKNKLSSWTLAGAVICILGGMVEISSPELEPSLISACATFLIGVILAVVTWRLRVSVRRDAAAAAQSQQESAEDKLRQEREAREARIREEERRFVSLRFPVAGVTFKNEDKSDRQKILREIYLNEDGHTTVSFQEDEGENAGIRVMTDVGCVGFVRSRDKEQIRRFFDRRTYSNWLSVERFEGDEGEKIYRADVCSRIDRDDPAEAWYFQDEAVGGAS